MALPSTIEVTNCDDENSLILLKQDETINLHCKYIKNVFGLFHYFQTNRKMRHIRGLQCFLLCAFVFSIKAKAIIYKVIYMETHV